MSNVIDIHEKIVVDEATTHYLWACLFDGGLDGDFSPLDVDIEEVGWVRENIRRFYRDNRTAIEATKLPIQEWATCFYANRAGWYSGFGEYGFEALALKSRDYSLFRAVAEDGILYIEGGDF